MWARFGTTNNFEITSSIFIAIMYRYWYNVYKIRITLSGAYGGVAKR